MSGIKTYYYDEKRKIEEVIPATFDVVFKALLITNRMLLAILIKESTSKFSVNYLLKNMIIINGEYALNNIKEKRKQSDIIVRVGNYIIDIEMDRNYYEKVDRKNNKYIHKLINAYEEEKIMQISLVNYKEKDKRKGPRKTISKYIFQDEYGNVEEFGYEKYKVDLEYIREKYYNNNKLTKKEKLFFMLAEKRRDVLKEISKGDIVMEEVYRKLDELSGEVELSLLYDKEERDKKTKELELEYMKEKGISLGLSQGISQGIEEGINSEKIKTAKNLISMNMKVEDISKVTGLKIEEINNLK